MKKVLKIFVLLAVMLIILTGCVDVNYEVTINSDGTADVAYIYGFEKEYLEEMETTAEEMTQEMQQNAELSDYTVETYSNDEVEGFKATKHVTDLSQISLEEAFGSEYVSDSEENQIKVEKKGSKTVYSQKADIDLTSMDESMASMVTMKYTIKLPEKAGNNNASEVSKDGKTLIWNLKAGEINKIEFEATESGAMDKIIRIVVIALVSLVGVAVVVTVIIVIVKKVKNKNNNEVKTENIEEEETINNEEKVIENEEKTNNEIDEDNQENSKE